MIVSRAARVLLVAIACVLLMPVVGIAWQDPIALTQFHNRGLSRPPKLKVLAADPTAFFAAYKAWLGERVFPIAAASRLQIKVLYATLGVPPKPWIAFGRDGLIFLTGSGADATSILRGVCVWAHTQEMRVALDDAMAGLAAFARRQASAIDVVVVPTLETLYGDRMPASVPRAYRDACSERATGRSPLLEVEASPPTHFVYPIIPMRERRDDAGFYPSGNWHPAGLSLVTVRNAYLAAAGLGQTTDEMLRATMGPAELLLAYEIEKPLPAYEVVDDRVTVDEVTASALQQSLANLVVYERPPQAFRTVEAPNHDTVLMISDSFGDLAARVFAGSFSRLMQVTTNNLAEHGIAEVLARVHAVAPFDRVILLMQEGDVDRIVEYGVDLGPGHVAPIEH